MSLSIKAIAFMPVCMPQTRKVALKIFLDDNEKPSEKEKEVISRMRQGEFRVVGKKDFIALANNSKICIKYNLTGPKEYHKETKKIPAIGFPRWIKTNQYYVYTKQEDYCMEGTIDIYQEEHFVTSFDVKAILAFDPSKYTEHPRGLDDEVDSESDGSSYESETDSVDSTTPSVTSTSDDRPTTIPYATSNQLIGQDGGCIEIIGFGVSITIPRGALQSNVPITVELIPNSLHKDITGDQEASVTHAVRCSPSGLKLQKPMTISCNHCARLDPSAKAEETPLVVYSATEPEGIEESLLVDLAEALETNEQLDTLGRVLGFSNSEIVRYAATNTKGEKVTFKGTQSMLFDWRMGVSPCDQYWKLRDALTNAKLLALRDKFLKEKPVTGENRRFERHEKRSPNSSVRENHLDFKMDELGTYEMRMPSEFLAGKVVGYLAFLPRAMPESRKPVLNLIIYDNVEGRKEGVTKEMEAIGRSSRDAERLFVIESSIQEDLEILCRVDETEGDREPHILDLVELNLGKNIVDFVLDFTNLPIHEQNVKVTLTHGKRRRVSILFADMKENAAKLSSVIE